MELIYELKEHLKDLNIQWQLCGGLAIDVYLGKETRKHKDIDISISFEDIKTCVEFLKNKGWKIVAPVGKGRFVDIDYAIENTELYFDNIWCYKGNCDFIKKNKTDGVFSYLDFQREEQKTLDFIEVMFNTVENGLFYYSRNHNITRELEKAIVVKDDIEILAPELVLLYKSKYYNNTDNQHDYKIVIDELDNDRQYWLVKSMMEIYSGEHPWI